MALCMRIVCTVLADSINYLVSAALIARAGSEKLLKLYDGFRVAISEFLVEGTRQKAITKSRADNLL